MSSKRYNKPIPFGWFAVGYTKELNPGDVKPLKYFNRELVLFRTESGQAVLLDAFCPHLGAHLGQGGIVQGESISCPFHAWKFNGEGHCTDIPYAKRMPPKVDGKQAIGHYPVEEHNHIIWAWYHPEGVEPLFEVETFEELDSPEWTDIQTFDWTIDTIIQEAGENGCDIAHFVTVHGAVDMPVGDVTMEGHTRRTIIDNEIAAIDEQGVVDRSGENVESIRLDSCNYGPGQFFQKFSRLFDVCMLGTSTPIDDQTTHLRFNFTTPKEQNDTHKLMTEGVINEIAHQVEQDMPIWKYKTYLESPVLCDGDGPIARYRKWFNQFYAETP